MFKFLAVAVACAASTLSAQQTTSSIAPFDSTGNILTDFSFEQQGKNWNIWGSTLNDVAHSGKTGLTVKNDAIQWNGAEQIIVLPDGAASVTVSGWIKTENVVQGKQSWENARISIELHNENGGLVGGYPPVVGQATGTTDWTHYSRTYRVVSGARLVQLQCALGNALGTAHFDDITLTIRSREGNLLQTGYISGIMDEGEWYPLDVKNASSGGNYVDWSGLLDAPAGKHGFLTVKDGNFFFEDSTPARFWGTNLVALDCFANDSQIDSAVTRLSRMGCNLLRLHHMDAPWSTPNIFGNDSTTRKLSPKSLRQLDYLISRCKEKGIYIFLDLLVHREFTKADGIENKAPELGGKQVGFFSKKLIDLQKEYIQQLLSHVNQFTKVAYKDEPAIVASEFINESTAFTTFTGDILTPPYRAELQDLWNQSSFKDKKLAVFGLDWQNDRPRLKVTSADGDVTESIRFLSSIETGYFKSMHDYMRSLGVRYPLVGSNMPVPLLAMLRDNATMDFICSNDYWDHPQVWKINNDWNNILHAPFHNRSQLKNPNASIIQNKSYFRVAGKPYLITEWNHCYPNEQVLEGVPLIAAYGALQGWNGILQFDFNLQTLGVDRIRNYTLSVQPEDIAQWVMAAPLFLRGDVKAAPGLLVEGITEEQLNSTPNYSTMLETNYQLPFITRVAKSFDGQSKGSPDQYSSFFSPESGLIRSETGELLLNSKTGYLSINAPKVQGATGFIGGTAFDFPLFSCQISNRHASVFAVSADGNDLVTSKHFYLVVTGPAKMKDQIYDPTRNSLKDPGNGQVLTQVIEGTITFKKVGGKKIQLYPLGLNGTKGKVLPVKKAKGVSGVFEMNQGRTLVYEIVVK